MVPVQVTEHVCIARTCPACRRRCIPPAQLDGVALGRQRLGVNLISRIATLREEGRLPIRSIQWYLCTVHPAAPQRGGHCIHQTAQQAQPAVAAILDRIRASPVVHADETGWRQNGANGSGLSAPPPNATSCERYFLRGVGAGGGGRSAVILRSTGAIATPPLRSVLGPVLRKSRDSLCQRPANGAYSIAGHRPALPG